MGQPRPTEELAGAGAFVLGSLIGAEGGVEGTDPLADVERFLAGLEVLARDPAGLGAFLPESLGLLAAIVAQAESSPGKLVPDGAAKSKEVRAAAAATFVLLSNAPNLAGVKDGLESLVLPRISGTVARSYSQRVNDVCAAFDRLLDLQHWTEDEELRSVLRRAHSYKFARFGTSGIRGLWGTDFTPGRIRCIAQAIVDSVGRTSRAPPRSVVVGYDSRRHADELGQRVAQVFLDAGFEVHLTGRDSPTPAINYYGTVELHGSTDGIVTCTASHNPVDWHGVKFTEPTGQPAATSRTNWIGARATQLLFARLPATGPDAPFSVSQKGLVSFDPLEGYCRWLLSKTGPNRLDAEAIRSWLGDKLVVVDEMHGAGRGYLPRLLHALGVPFVTVHGVADPGFGRLHYPLPEAPDLADCQEATRVLGAAVGVALDGDADRFGAVDGTGEILPQNQVLALLVEHMLRMGRRGRVIRGFPTLLAIDDVVRRCAAPGQVPSPDPGAVPAYARSPAFVVRHGRLSDLAGSPAFVTSVGMKYLAEAARMDSDYRLAPRAEGPSEPVLIVGEDNGGLTTGGHLYDKDGIWSDLLVLEMISVRRTSLLTLWSELESRLGTAWQYRRLDLDGMEEAKERLVNYFLAELPATPDPRIAGARCDFIGGLPGEMVEVRFSEAPGLRGRLIVRSSGTEPVCRIYTECTDPGKRREVESAVLEKLDELGAAMVLRATDPRLLVETLLVSSPLPRTIRQVRSSLARMEGKSGSGIRETVGNDLARRIPSLDTRRRASAERWVSVLG